MKKSLLFFSTCFAFCLISAAGAESAGSWRVALTDFSSDDRSYRSLEVGKEFASMLADLLYATTDFEWVERQELDAAFRELELGAYGWADPVQAIRAGSWVGADLLLTGSFEADEQSRHLRLEVIDLRRADVLGETMVPMTGNRRSAILLRQTEVSEAAKAASGLLKAATGALDKRAGQKTVASLFFRNADTARRLDYLEERFAETLAQKIANAPTLHMLHFPKADAARGEMEMVVNGLAAVDHNAWQRVADSYVWGEYREVETEDRPLVEAVIEAKVFFWDGSGDFQHIVRRGQVREQERLLVELVREVLNRAGALEATTPSDAARASVARHLLDREGELKRSLEIQAKEIHGFRGSPAASALRRYRIALLETIRFFEPNNRYAHWESLALQTEGLNQWTPRLTHVAVTEGYWQWLRQYGFDTENPATAGEAGIAFRRIRSLVRHLQGREYRSWAADDLPTSLRVQWEREWADRFVEGALRWNALAERDRKNRFPLQNLRTGWLEFGMDDLENEQAERLISGLWESYRNGFLEESALVGFQEEELFGKIRQFYHRQGRPEKAEELLAGLEALTPAARMRENRLRIEEMQTRAREASPPPAPPAPPKTSGPRPAPRATKPGLDDRVRGWFGSEEKEREEEQRLEELRARMIPFASVPEMEPRMRRVILPLPDNVAQQGPAWRIEDLGAKDGNLWIRGHILRASAASFGAGWGPEQFDSAAPVASVVWKYDPISGSGQPVWQQPVMQGLVTDLELNGGALWLAFDRTGLLRQSPTGEEERLGLEEGLLSLNLFALAEREERLYFGGGIGGEPLLGYLHLPTRQVFRIEIPREPGPARTRGPQAEASGGVRQLVPGGEWLLVETDRIQFLNVTTSDWLNGGGGYEGVAQSSTRPGFGPGYGRGFQRQAVTPAVYDGEAFWFGSKRSLLRFRPGRDAEPVEVGARSPSAVAFDGELIWAAFNTGAGRRTNSDSRPPVHRNGPDVSPFVAAWSGESREWIVRFAVPHPATSLAADGNSVWVAMDDVSGQLLEIDRGVLAPGAVSASGEAAGGGAALDPGIDLAGALEQAVFAGQLDEVRRLIEVGALPSAAERETPPLTIAVRRGHFAVAEALLAAGADPNAVAATGDFPLLLAVEMKQPGIVGLLLRAGADPDQARATDGVYPLLAAINGDDPGTTGMLLAFRANPDGPARPQAVPGSLASRVGIPLVAAVERKDLNSVEALLQKGANIDQRTAGKTALTVAAAAGNYELASRLLARGADPNLPGTAGRTPLHLATGSKDDRLFHLLLDHRADPAIPSHFGETPLGAAIARNATDRVEILLERLGDPAGRLGEVQRGTDALTRAVQRNDLKLVRKFLEAGVNPNVSSDRDKKPLLNLAVEQEASPEVVRLLLAFGADLHPQDREHHQALVTGSMSPQIRDILEEARKMEASAWSEQLGIFAAWRGMRDDEVSLIKAARSGDSAGVKALLDAGVSPNVRDHRGRVSLIHAIQEGHADVAALLLERGANPRLPTAYGSTALAFATERRDVVLTRRLLEEGADPNAALYRSSHPIHLAAAKGDSEILGLLIQHGTDVNQRSSDDQDALNLAIDQQDFDCVKLLLAAGADPESEGVRRWPEGTRRLRAVEGAAAAGNADILKLLIEAGASVHPSNPRGPTPLEYALQNRRAENVSILRAAGAKERPLSVVRNVSPRYEGDGPLPHVRDFATLRSVVEEQGFDVNAVQGATLLQQFLRHYRDIQPALYLIERGADVNAIGSFPFNTLPIVMAVQEALSKGLRDNPPDSDLILLLQAMLERGADINARDPVTLETVLMSAVGENRDQLVEFLLRVGADRSLTDIQGKSALDYVRSGPFAGPIFDREAADRIRELLGGPDGEESTSGS